MLAVGLWCDEVAFCLPGRFLSCLVAMGSTGGISKFACKCFLGGAVSSMFKVEVGGTSAQQGMPQLMTGNSMRGSGRSACSVGRFSVRGRCMAGSGCGCSAVVGRGSSGKSAWFVGGFPLSVMYYSGVSLVVTLNLILILVWFMWMGSCGTKC